MKTLEVRNVCQALSLCVEYLLSSGRPEKSRAGDVIVAPFPVMTITRQPTERVLLSRVRDANPFFHLYEAMWMLGGREDSAPLNEFVRDFGRSYGEGDGRVHGAYGRRWRTALGFDQLSFVVETLGRDPTSRQCVIQMWDSSAYAYRQSVGHDDLRGSWRDRPCNTHCYLRVLDGALDLTVCCRSNDMILGAHGANAVHFSVLQEYLAARIGVRVGFMYQLSNNAHAYVAELDRLRDRAARHHSVNLSGALWRDLYSEKNLRTTPLFDVPDRIDEDVGKFLAWYDCYAPTVPKYANRWFSTTLTPVVVAHKAFKVRDYDWALRSAGNVEAEDWRMACAEWIERRAK